MKNTACPVCGKISLRVFINKDFCCRYCGTQLKSNLRDLRAAASLIFFIPALFIIDLIDRNYYGFSKFISIVLLLISTIAFDYFICVKFLRIKIIK
jgi:predicted nucleic acid-binding Zn ribbon protein